MSDKPTPDTRQEVIAAILELVDDGKSLRQACKEIGFPRKTFEHWVDADPELKAQYARARDNRAEKLFEEILTIQDERPEEVIQLDPNGEGGTKRIDPAFVTWQKNRVEARRWMIGKMAPKKYGDKVDVELSGSVKSESDFDLSKLTPEELIALRALQAKAANDAPADT